MEVRELVYPSLRFFTNGCYFIMGMNLRMRRIKNDNHMLVIPTIILSMIATFCLSDLVNNVWASSMYCSIPVIYGTLAIFCVMNNNKLKLHSCCLSVISTSTGIWILHPFIFRVMSKTYRTFGGEISLAGKVVILLITLAVSAILTLIMKRNKRFSRLITI